MANESGETVQESIEQKIETGKNMAVKVYSPFKVYYDGLALSVSAESKTGPFDILPKHHNFITLLEPCDLTIRVEGQDDQIIPITGGIMHVKADQVTVFLDV
jgi:F0F1-type ATP synthase epsilon subunit